jgi:hypothetical protein
VAPRKGLITRLAISLKMCAGSPAQYVAVRYAAADGSIRPSKDGLLRLQAVADKAESTARCQLGPELADGR